MEVKMLPAGGRMASIGIIGLGSMGTMLARALLRTGAVAPSNLIVVTRTTEKARLFCEAHSGVEATTTVGELAARVDWIFVAVPPAEVKGVLEVIASSPKHGPVISLASSVTLACLQSVVGRGVTRVIPNITAEVDMGVFLVCHGPAQEVSTAQAIERLLGRVATVFPIREDQIEVATDVCSCSPGVFSALFRLFLEAVQRNGDLGDLAVPLFRKMLSGLSQLYETRGWSFEETIAHVARKGGVTEIGIEALGTEQSVIFDRVLERTLENHREKKARMEEEYGLR
jgi:pyrroline-5-carboxylate reductase